MMRIFFAGAALVGLIIAWSGERHPEHLDVSYICGKAWEIAGEMKRLKP